MTQFKLFNIEVKEDICILKINRPEALNALNSSIFKEMKVFLEDLEGDKNIRALIITGEGKAFVAGADIAEMVNMNSEEAEQFSRTGKELFSSLENLDIPVIAAVNGFALGGGCELAMACDIRIASEYARFGQPEVNLGLIPGYAGSQRMPRLLGLGNALYYLMTGDQIKSDEALRIGLVQKLVEHESLMNEAFELAKKISSKGPKAVGKVKKTARQGLEKGMISGSELETKEFSSLFGNEGTEGMKAFLDKRKPNWK